MKSNKYCVLTISVGSSSIELSLYETKEPLKQLISVEDKINF